MAKKRDKSLKPINDYEREAVRKGYRRESRDDHNQGRGILTPLGRERVSQMYLTGYSPAEISREVGISYMGVKWQIENNLAPMWEQRMADTLAKELARMEQIEREAWAAFRRSTDDETIETIEKTLLDRDDAGTLQLSKQIIRKMKRDGTHNWLAVIQWCSDFRAKVAGWYKREDANPHELRIAGKTREQVQAELTERIAVALEERAKDKPEEVE